MTFLPANFFVLKWQDTSEMCAGFKQRPLTILVLACLLSTSCDSSLTSQSDSLPEIPMTGLNATVSSHIQGHVQDVHQRPQSGAALGKLAMVLHSYRLNEAAEPYYRQARKLQSDEFQWHYLHAVTLQELSRNSEALENFVELEKTRRGYFPIRLRIANLMAQNNQLDSSLELFAELTRQEPDQAIVFYGYAQVLLLKNNVTSALTALKRAVFLDPNYRAAHYALANAYRANGQAQNAAKHSTLFEQLEDRTPVAHDPIIVTMKSLARTEFNAFNSALRALRTGDMNGALEQFERVIEFNPDNYSARANLIGLYGDKGQFELAEQHFEAAKIINPEHAKLYNNIGSIRLRNQQTEQARQALAIAVELDPTYAVAWRNLGKAYEELGDTDKAMEHYKNSLQLDDQNRQTWFFYGRLQLILADVNSAVTSLSKTLEPVDVKTPHYYRGYAQALAAQDRSSDARVALEKAIELARRTRQSLLVPQLERDISALNATGVIPID